MPGLTRDRARSSVEGWKAGKPSVSGDLARRLLAGDTIGSEDVPAGRSPSLLSQVVQALELSGYRVERIPVPGRVRAVLYRVASTPKARAEISPAPPTDPEPERGEPVQSWDATIASEIPGETYPTLGSSLVVRVLALTGDGRLVMHLANGRGTWQAEITGHVAAVEP